MGECEEICPMCHSLEKEHTYEDENGNMVQGERCSTCWSEHTVVSR